MRYNNTAIERFTPKASAPAPERNTLPMYLGITGIRHLYCPQLISDHI